MFGVKRRRGNSDALMAMTLATLNQGPQFTLPAEAEPTVREPLTAAEVVYQGLAANDALPDDLQITANNPIFGSIAQQEYADRFFDTAIVPALDAQRIDNYLSGNADSTFGATALTNLAVQGRNQAFFAGEDFRNRRVTELLNRRQSFFGNEGRIAQEQNALGIQRDLGVENLRGQRMGILNQFNLSKAGILGNLHQVHLGAERADEAAEAQAKSSLFGGLFGLAGGGLNSLFGGGGSGGGSFGGSGGGFYSAPRSGAPAFTMPQLRTRFSF